MFWALKGATLILLRMKIRQKAVTAMDLPTSLPVPRNMRVLVMNAESFNIFNRRHPQMAADDLFLFAPRLRGEYQSRPLGNKNF
jgi:hypothetical protein